MRLLFASLLFLLSQGATHAITISHTTSTDVLFEGGLVTIAGSVSTGSSDPMDYLSDVQWFAGGHNGELVSRSGNEFTFRALNPFLFNYTLNADGIYWDYDPAYLADVSPYPAGYRPSRFLLSTSGYFVVQPGSEPNPVPVTDFGSTLPLLLLGLLGAGYFSQSPRRHPLTA
jgi:hypothetical protein